MNIEINGIPIEVVKKQIKNMNVRIYPPDGLVKASAPLHYSDCLIKHQLQEKSIWIQAQRERMRGRPSYKDKEHLLQTGASIGFKGTNHFLIVEEHYGPSHITIKDDLIYLYINPNASQAQRQALIEQWYRKEMKLLIPDLIQHWEAIINVKVAQWGIKKMKTRWGSCNTRAHRIWLNLNLMTKSIECLEYVLVHELVHLLEASHNQRFYTLMTQFMPHWRQYQLTLEGRPLKNKHLSKLKSEIKSTDPVLAEISPSCKNIGSE